MFVVFESEKIRWGNKISSESEGGWERRGSEMSGGSEGGREVSLLLKSEMRPNTAVSLS
jgi:hypothetical protein